MSIDELKAVFPKPDQLAPADIEAKAEALGVSKTVRCSTQSWRSGKNATPTLTIEFRDLDYAFEVFSGSITLQDALAARYFTTHGPNDKGVAVTYLFTVILKAFFGWRKSYRR